MIKTKAKYQEGGYGVKKWTRRKYVQLYHLGMLGDQKVELINGVIEYMSPQFDYHYGAIDLTAKALEGIFGIGYWVRRQCTLNLGAGCMPDPDIAVVVGSPKGARRRFQSKALLVIEVSDSTLQRDRRIKRPMYAKYGIADFWIVNLVSRQLEIYREPRLKNKTAGIWDYRRKTVFGLTQSVSPFAMPKSRIAVADMFP